MLLHESIFHNNTKGHCWASLPRAAPNGPETIWSLGCVLYELSTLKHAFDGTSLRGLLQKIVRGNYPPLPQLYSPAWRSLVLRSCLLLNRDPPVQLPPKTDLLVILILSLMQLLL